MKCAYVLLLACCLLAVGLAKPAVPLLNYQDNYGQYSFGYSGPTSARSEVRTLDGVTRGTYSYIDDAGVIQTARYIADDMGFRIIATNIPQGPVYLRTPQDVGLLQLRAQEADQAPNLGETNVFLKEAKQEAALTPGDNQQAPGAASGAGTGPASGNLQTKIGENNVFLQQAIRASGEIQIPEVVALVNAGGFIQAPSIERTTEAGTNEYIKRHKYWIERGKIENVEENVKSDYNIAAAGVATNKDGSQGNLNIAAKKTEGESAQKGASGEIPKPELVALDTTGLIQNPRIERPTEAGTNEVLKPYWKVFGNIGNVEENVKSDYNIAAAGVATNKDDSQGNLNIAAKVFRHI